jgi:hypothetical protein
VEWAQSLAAANPLVDESVRLRAFRDACEQLGIHLPANFEALLVLAQRFKAAGNPDPT